MVGNLAHTETGLPFFLITHVIIRAGAVMLRWPLASDVCQLEECDDIGFGCGCLAACYCVDGVWEMRS